MVNESNLEKKPLSYIKVLSWYFLEKCKITAKTSVRLVNVLAEI
jgi:hypothetical protein